MCLCLPEAKDETKKGVCAIKGALRMRSAEPQRNESGVFIFSRGSYVVVVVAAADRWQRRHRLALAKIASAPLRLADG